MSLASDSPGPTSKSIRTGGAFKSIRRIVVSVIGVTVVMIGMALILLPGPGLIVIFAGLAILGLEFAWARNLYLKGRQQAASLLNRTKKRSPKS
ncbi:MAG: PGPGW domain-containing protein [candidate division Zixibacteria bacterium]|nr:PGPGW domain-containing protein [candidate division Zixibacteria bacterium]